MTMKLSYITFSIFFSTLMYAECGNYDFEECLINTDCYWEENLQSYNCSQFNSSDQCNSYSEYGCYTSWNSTNWEDDCEGGQFTIDYGYCLENAMPECSSLNILDVIQTVNHILYNEYNFVVDINQDDIINIQDVILIISLIL